MRDIALLGSTGSIGTNTLEVCRRFGIGVDLLVAGRNASLLNRQIEEFSPSVVVVADEETASRIEHPKILVGEKAILDAIESSDAETVVNSLVGYTGLAPTLKSLECGKRLALANKESLVSAGYFIDTSSITPIDSEHFGLWYLLNGREISRLVITASGGAFRDWDIRKMREAGYGDALNHPNWSMGNKITIDSATMMNKLFELLEARWLFDTERVDAYIERRSIVHALVEFTDGSTTAHMAGVDMKLPIAHALECPISSPILPPVNLVESGDIRFEEIDEKRYPVWELKEHLLSNPRLGTVLNAANEAAMGIFERGECDFGGMNDIVIRTYDRFSDTVPETITDVFEIDKTVREYVSTEYGRS